MKFINLDVPSAAPVSGTMDQSPQAEGDGRRRRNKINIVDSRSAAPRMSYFHYPESRMAPGYISEAAWNIVFIQRENGIRIAKNDSRFPLEEERLHHRDSPGSAQL